jgi:ATP-dependent exoDNAse (exonuclease V) beta subunit
MTAHRAKGLEFPVVILADMTAKLRNERADRLIDKARNACYLRLGRWTPAELAANEPLEVARDEAEGVRVAYVAATRARDLLVVPGVGDVEYDGGWISPLNRAVYPPLQARRTATAAPFHPPFKKDSVFRRPDDEPFTSATVQPGVHRLGDGDESYSVVWWDPHALSLGAEASLGIRRESLIMKDVAPAVIEEGLREYERWERQRADTAAAGAIPSVAVAAVTEWAADPASEPGMLLERGAREALPAPVQYGLFEAPAGETPAPAPSREATVLNLHQDSAVGGARFGELVHAILATVPLDADRETCAEVAAVQARILGAPDAERAAAVDAVTRVLAHDLLRRAAAAERDGRARRECPVTIATNDGTVLEGVVDLAFEEQGVWTVVDFKTDRETSHAGFERYVRQLAVYAAAIERATSSPTRAFLVRV